VQGLGFRANGLWLKVGIGQACIKGYGNLVSGYEIQLKRFSEYAIYAFGP